MYLFVYCLSDQIKNYSRKECRVRARCWVLGAVGRGRGFRWSLGGGCGGEGAGPGLAVMCEIERKCPGEGGRRWLVAGPSLVQLKESGLLTSC